MERVELRKYVQRRGAEIFHKLGFEKDFPNGRGWYMENLDEHRSAAILVGPTSTPRGVTMFPYIHVTIFEVQNFVAKFIYKTEKSSASTENFKYEIGATFACAVEYLTPAHDSSVFSTLTGPEHAEILLARTARDLVEHALPFVKEHVNLPTLVDELENKVLYKTIRVPTVAYLPTPAIYILTGRYSAARAFIQANIDRKDKLKPAMVSIGEYCKRLLDYIESVER